MSNDGCSEVHARRPRQGQPLSDTVAGAVVVQEGGGLRAPKKAEALAIKLLNSCMPVLKNLCYQGTNHCQHISNSSC